MRHGTSAIQVWQRMTTHSQTSDIITSIKKTEMARTCCRFKNVWEPAGDNWETSGRQDTNHAGKQTLQWENCGRQTGCRSCWRHLAWETTGRQGMTCCKETTWKQESPRRGGMQMTKATPFKETIWRQVGDNSLPFRLKHVETYWNHYPSSGRQGQNTNSVANNAPKRENCTIHFGEHGRTLFHILPEIESPDPASYPFTSICWYLGK